MSNKIQVTIDPSELFPSYDEYGEAEPPATMQDLVIEAAARQILRGDEFDKEVRRKVQEIVQSEAERQVGELVRKTLEEPFNITSRWGEVQHENVTARELIRENIAAWFGSKTPARDHYGTPTKSLEGLIADVTRNVLDKELQTEIANVRKRVAQEIRDKALKAAVDAISPRP